MNVIRTYPQPDSPLPNIGPRERALAVFKYLLDLEPEAAARHRLFPVIVHAFEQSRDTGWNEIADRLNPVAVPPVGRKRSLGPSLCEQLSKSFPAEAKRL